MAVLSTITPRSGQLASVCMALALTGVAPMVSFDTAQEPVSVSVRVAGPNDQQRLADEGAELARRFAPAFSQDTSPDYPERDRPLRLDFDGDWNAENNWAHLRPEHTQSDPAVYTSFILTETHGYLTYTLFFPRDWTSFPCVPYLCHDNDLESLLLVVTRGPRPEVVLLETKFHGGYVAARGDELRRGESGQPLVTVESEGHGMLPARHDSPLGEHAVRYLERSARDETPGAQRYDLLPLRESLWARRTPVDSDGRLWTPGEGGYLSYTGARLGELGRPLGAAMSGREYTGGVRPPWAIGAEGRRGDWFLDPAFVALSRHKGSFRGQASTTYVLNTYVDDLARECVGPACFRARAESEASVLSPGGLLTGLGLLLLRAGKRPHRGSARDRARLPMP